MHTLKPAMLTRPCRVDDVFRIRDKGLKRTPLMPDLQPPMQADGNRLVEEVCLAPWVRPPASQPGVLRIPPPVRQQLRECYGAQVRGEGCEKALTTALCLHY